MPFDPETGNWTNPVDRPYGLPATSAGDVLGAFNTYGEYQRNRDARLLDTILKIRQSGEAGYDVSQTPSGGAAMADFGIQPTEVQDMYLQSPEQRFREGVKQMHESGQPIDEQAVAELGLQTGYINPKDYFLSGSRAIGARARETSAEAQSQGKFNQAAREEWKSALEQSDDPTQAGQIWKSRMQFLYPGMAEERYDSALAALQKSFGGDVAAKRGKIAAETEFTGAKTWALEQKTPAQIRLMDSKSVLDYASADLKKAQQIVEQKKADGTLPASQKDLTEALSRVDTALVQAEKIFPVTKEQKAGVPALISDLKARSEALKADIAAASAPATAPAAGPATKEKKGGKLPAGALGKATQPDGTKKFYQGKPVVVRGGYWYYADAAAVR